MVFKYTLLLLCLISNVWKWLIIFVEVFCSYSTTHLLYMCGFCVTFVYYVWNFYFRWNVYTLNCIWLCFSYFYELFHIVLSFWLISRSVVCTLIYLCVCVCVCVCVCMCTCACLLICILRVVLCLVLLGLCTLTSIILITSFLNNPNHRLFPASRHPV
jgi:hypothetical protein